LVYNNLDALKKVEPKDRLIKATLAEKGTFTRRQRKNARKQKMNVWGPVFARRPVKRGGSSARRSLAT
jgi:hypothetical protein